MNKCLYLLPLACLVGFLVGSWGPRADLRALKELEQNEKKAAAEQKPDGFETFARMAKIPETARHPRRKRPSRAEARRSAIAVTNTPRAEVSAAASEVPNAGARAAAPEDLAARIDEAQELWATRVDMARAQWKAKLNLSGEAEKAFDDALQEMNEKLYVSVTALAQRLASAEKMTPELGLRLVGDTTAIMAETYDRIGSLVPQGRRAEVSEMHMVDFIDPAVAEPLIDVQDKLVDFSMHPDAEGR